MRSIGKGEEVTVSYMACFAARTSRRSFLVERFKFECECVLCKHPSDESDTQLSKIQELIDDVPRVGFTDPQSALKISQLTLRLMQREGVDTPENLGPIHYDAYQMAKAIGDGTSASLHITSALECAKLSGDDASAVKYREKIRLA
jgi:hypothetical protein